MTYSPCPYQEKNTSTTPRQEGQHFTALCPTALYAIIPASLPRVARQSKRRSLVISMNTAQLAKTVSFQFCSTMDDQLHGTFLTGSKLQNFLSTSSSVFRNHQLKRVEAKIIGDGQGFTSKIMRVNLEWSQIAEDTTLPPKSVIVKVIGSQAVTDMFDMDPVEVEKMKKQVEQIHNIECAIYGLDEFSKTLNLPICYFMARNTTDQPGIIILEDLGDRAAAMTPRQIGVGLNDAQLDQMIDALATLHSWSVNTTVDWRSDVPSFEGLGIMQNLFVQLAGMYEKTKATYPHAFDGVDEGKLKQYLNLEKYLNFFGSDPKPKYGLPTVLAHGDIHFVNVLFEKDANGKVGDKLAALIDWQFAHRGCGMEDLARMVAMSISVDRKHKERDQIVRRYVEVRRVVMLLSLSHEAVRAFFSCLTPRFRSLKTRLRMKIRNARSMISSRIRPLCGDAV